MRELVQFVWSMGYVFAVVISVIINKSFWWAVLHFFLGWFYVIYYIFTRYVELKV